MCECVCVCYSFQYILYICTFLCIVEVFVMSSKTNTSTWASDIWFLWCVLLCFKCWRWYGFCIVFITWALCKTFFIPILGIGEYCWLQSFNRNRLLITSRCHYDKIFFFFLYNFVWTWTLSFQRFSYFVSSQQFFSSLEGFSCCMQLSFWKESYIKL